jgi:pimeloyl-ACP methyl ester carboxylesterase
MSHLLTLPRMGETMETGRVVSWLKQPGDSFRRGETIVEIESDKTVVELPALADGRLLEVLAQVGADVAVGEPLCRYDAGEGSAPAEMTEALKPTAPIPEAPMSVAVAPVAASPAQQRAAQTTSERLRATPLARRLARQGGVDLAMLTGSGRRGRIEARDVRGAGAASSDALAVTRWPAAGAAARAAVLLHGFGGDAQTWAALAALLTRSGIAVAAPDLPGHGATALDAEDIASLAAPLGALLDGAVPVELVGHSLGGAVAVALARAYPHRVARLTLIAPLGLDSGIDADFVEGLARAHTAGGLTHLLRRLSPRPPVLSSVQVAQMAAQTARGRLVALAHSLVADGRQQVDIVPDLAALPMRVRVIWGLEDRIIPWTQAARLPTRVAVHFVPGAGHMPHWDAPHHVAELFDP